MHDLITGGSGFIGRALCRALLDDGHRVTVLTRNPQRAQHCVPDGVHCIDTLDGLSGIDTIYNLAGENLSAGRWTTARKQAFRDSRVAFTERLVGWIRGLEVRPKVLVSGSAIGIYGTHGDEIVTEQTPPGEDFAATLCRDWEAAAREATAVGLRVCTPRIGIVLGVDGGALAKMLTPFRLGLGGPMGRGDQWMSWIHRADLVALLQWLGQTPSAHDAFNATAPEPVRNRDFAVALGRALHRPAVLPTPAPMLKLLFGEMAEALLLSGQRVLPRRAHETGFMFHHATLDAALRDLLGSR